MNSRRVLAGVSAIGSFLLLSCNDDSNNAAVDSSVAITPQRAAPPPAVSTGWDDAAGPVLILSMTTDPGNTAVVLPQLNDSSFDASGQQDFSALTNSRVELFGPQGLAGEATLTAVATSAGAEGCRAWPQGRVSGSTGKPWKVGFLKGRVTGMPVDSIEGMSAADSAAFTADIIRIVSSLVLPGDSVFRGLPFSVRKAYRFAIGPTPAFAASVVRKINQEANPRQEHYLIVAERAGENYREAFQTRTAGSEELVQTNEILAVVNLVETGQPAIVATFEYEDGGRVGLLERASGGRWRVVWRSAYTGC